MRQGLVFSIIVLAVFCAPVWGVGSDMGGTDPNGSESHPYLIEDLADFDTFSGDPNYWASGVHTKLMTDIDLSGRTYTAAVIAPDTESTSDPLDFEFDGILFAGVFDGNGFSIINLTIDTAGADSDYLGLFGLISGSDAEVKNIGIEDVTINGGSDSHLIGGLCGRNGDYLDPGVGGLINNCYSTNSVINGFWGMGGLVGWNEYGSVTNCYSAGSVSCILGGATGGLMGGNAGGSVMNCYSSGSVNGGLHAGGLVGENYDTIVTNCYSTSTVSGVSGVGGLVGLNSENFYASLVMYCYSTGSVSGSGEVGGLIGRNEYGSVENCYTIGPVNGGNGGRSVGGLLGENNGSVTNCYSTGRVNGTVSDIGGFCGCQWWSSRGEINNCFWDVETSEIGSAGDDNCGATGKMTADVQTQSTFNGWDFIGETTNGTEDIWGIHEGSDYPRLWWEFTNMSPVPDAGVDQTMYAFVDGCAMVYLDGTGSTDEDGDMLEYYWYNDANDLIASGAEPNVVLPVGEHVIDLVVNDGIEDSEADFCVVTVVGAIETAAELTPQVLNRDSGRPHVIGRLAFAGEAMPVLDPNEPMVLLAGQGQIEDQRQMLTYSKKEDVWYLAGFFDNAALMAAITEDGDVEVTIAAKLLTGQWMYGRDVVTVK